MFKIKVDCYVCILDNGVYGNECHAIAWVISARRMNDRSLISKSKNCRKNHMSVTCTISTDGRIANDSIGPIKYNSRKYNQQCVITEWKQKQKKRAKERTNTKQIGHWSSSLFAEMVKTASKLLQFKAYKPKSYLLYGYCITVNIDQHETTDENHFNY